MALQVPPEKGFGFRTTNSEKRPVDSINNWTLRFGTRLHERGFVQFNTDPLRRSFRGCGLVSLGISAFFLVYTLFIETENDSQIPRALMWMSFVLLAVTVVLGSTCTSVVRKINPLAFEIAIAAFIFVLVPCVYLQDANCFCVLFGYDWRVFLRGGNTCFSDTAVLLGLDILITGTHLVLPVRWCVLWPIELAAISSYGLRYALVPACNDTDILLINLPLLVFLVVLSGFGKRENERIARSGFLAMIQERTLRCEAERVLATFEDIDSIRRGPGVADDSMSLPTTTPTGATFYLDGLETEAGAEESLQGILDLGSKEHWLIESEHVHLNVDELLGSGSYGLVVAGLYYGAPVAVKMSRHAGKVKNHSLVSILNELRILRQVRHTNLVLLYGACIDVQRRDLALVLERIDGVELASCIGHQDGNHTLNRTQRYQVLLDVSCAVRYLHARRPCIVHSDLKASNVLIESTSSGVKAKLCDFGFARLRTRSSIIGGGTLSYMAPEIICSSNNIPASPVDVFSFGRLAYFVATGTPPYPDLSKKGFQKAARVKMFPALPWPSEGCFLEECQDLVRRCLQFDPHVRPSMSSVQECLLSWAVEDPDLWENEMSANLVSWNEAAPCLRSALARKHNAVPRCPRPHLSSPRRPIRASSFSTLPRASTTAKRIPWLSAIVVEVDIADDGLPLQSCNFFLLPTEEMPQQLVFHPATKLSQWMTQDGFYTFCKALQEACNTVHYYSESSRLARPLLSFAFSIAHETCAILPNVVRVKDGRASEGSQKSSSSNNMFPLTLTLQDFTWASDGGQPMTKVHRWSSDLPPIFEDNGTSFCQVAI